MPTPERSTMAPLSGVLVLEVGQALAGPYGAQILADLGARVIKIEKPGGDDSRGMPPYFVGDSSAYFMSVNHSKESLVLDLKSPEGREVFLRLAAKADIVIENNRPGVMAKLGLGLDDLGKVNPKIVLCSVSGFGQDGPYRDLPAYDMIIQAMSGGMSITGEPTGKPVRSGVPIGDMAAGLSAALAAVSALRLAQITGKPQHADVAMLDVQISMLSYHIAYYLYSGVVPSLQGRAHTGIPEMGAYECADGVEVLLAPLGEQMWSQVCAALERPDLLADETLATRAARAARRDELRAILGETFRTRTAAAWVERLRAHGIPTTGINTIDKVTEDPHVNARGMVWDAAYGEIPIRLVGAPVRFAGVEPAYADPPKLGADTARILSEDAGFTAAEIAALERGGVVACDAEGPAANAAGIRAG